MTNETTSGAAPSPGHKLLVCQCCGESIPDLPFTTTEEQAKLALRDVLIWYGESPIREIQMANDLCGIKFPIRAIEAALAAPTPSRAQVAEGVKAIAGFLMEAANRYTKCLERDDWRPSRAHIEQARNTIVSAANTLEQAALSRVSVEAWQPIESAPKDGNAILVWSPSWHGGGRVFIACWEENKYSKKPRPYWSFSDERVFGTNCVRAHQPTHWIPLPPPPASGEGR